jgi:hypothetical protein
VSVAKALIDARRKHCASNGETVTALGAARPDHRTTATGFHANKETVRAFATDDGRLVSAFHYVSAYKKVEPVIKSNNALFVKRLMRIFSVSPARQLP